MHIMAVALRKESVDRNTKGGRITTTIAGSLSARRAWIEIVIAEPLRQVFMVALRKESVDRNNCRCYPCNTCYRSLSARRAWIEIGGNDHEY